MPEPTPPRTILCATDLSSRCDRALDRAALLARHWQAQLVVVHALQTATEFIEWLCQRTMAHFADECWPPCWSA
jgi:hypothetical protein